MPKLILANATDNDLERIFINRMEPRCNFKETTINVKNFLEMNTDFPLMSLSQFHEVLDRIGIPTKRTIPNRFREIEERKVRYVIPRRR